MANILQKWLDLPQGSPGLGSALRTLLGNAGKNIQGSLTGDISFKEPIMTAYGEAGSQNSLQEDFERAQQERQAEIDQAEAAKQAEILRQQTAANMPSSVNSPMYGQDLGVGFGGPNDIVAQYEAPQQVMGAQAPQVSLEDFEPIVSKGYWDQDWSTAPTYSEGFPQDMADIVEGYQYGNTGNKSWLDSDYIQLLWNEVNQQAPDLPQEDKLAFMRTIMDIGFAESHLGADYHSTFKEDLDPSNINRRTANAWNMGFNSNRGYDKNFDTGNREEMSDFLVKNLINTFGVIKNRGLSDQQAHNYHSGGGNAYNQAGVDSYRGLMGGSNTIFGDMYRWQ